GAVHDSLVGPFEVERVDQRLAHAGIAELDAAQIDEPALRARGRVVGQLLAPDAAVLERGKVVARRPDARRQLLAIKIALAGKTLEGDVAIAIIFVAHGVEVEAAAADRQVGAPPILDAIILDVAVDLKPADLVGPRTQRRIEARFVERACRVKGPREDR